MAAERASAPMSQMADESSSRMQPHTTTSPQTKLQEQTDVLPSSTPVEMSQLSQHQPLTSQLQSGSPTDASPPISHPLSLPTVAGTSEPQTAPATTSTSSVEHADSPMTVLPGPGLTADTLTSPQTGSIPSSAAIGPSLDQNATANAILPSSTAQSTSTGPTSGLSPSPTEGGPAVLITLILLNGKRHPFKIDTKYLKKRNVFKEDATDTDPFSISIYTLKELIWRDWRDEWDPRPTHPGNIRLIHFGKLLEDKVVLKNMKLQPDTPNIFHMSVKPQDFIDDEENAKLKGTKSSPSRSRLGLGGGAGEDGETSAGCCRCTVM